MDLNQVTIGTRDFDRSVEFYTRLGLKLIVHSEGRYARFELPSGSSTLSIYLDPDHVPSSAMLYFEVDDLAGKYAELVNRGISFETEPTDQSWNWSEARFRDPDGNPLCLFHGGQDRRFPPWRVQSSGDV